jgi:hypothetical protein
VREGLNIIKASHNTPEIIELGISLIKEAIELIKTAVTIAVTIAVTAI